MTSLIGGFSRALGFRPLLFLIDRRRLLGGLSMYVRIHHNDRPMSLIGGYQGMFVSSSPSTSPVPEAVGRKFLFGPLAEKGLVGAGRNRSQADQTGPDRRSANICIGPEIRPEVKRKARPTGKRIRARRSRTERRKPGRRREKLKLQYRDRCGTDTV